MAVVRLSNLWSAVMNLFVRISVGQQADKTETEVQGAIRKLVVQDKIMIVA